MNLVIDFWFNELQPSDWYKKSDALDTRIKDRFEATYNQIVAGETADWRATPEGRLAEIIVLDQFARNMFRARLHRLRPTHWHLHSHRRRCEVAMINGLRVQKNRFFICPSCTVNQRKYTRERWNCFKARRISCTKRNTRPSLIVLAAIHTEIGFLVACRPRKKKSG